MRRATRDDAGDGWADLGAATDAKGLDLHFDADDDPDAEASFLAGDGRRPNTTLAHRLKVRLTGEFATRHVHTRGYVFRVRLRGTGAAVGKEICLQMRVDAGGRPYCGRIENDDDSDAAVGDWIEFERVEILRVGPR